MILWEQSMVDCSCFFFENIVVHALDIYDHISYNIDTSIAGHSGVATAGVTAG